MPVTRKQHKTTMAVVKRTMALCHGQRQAAEADDQAIQTAAKERLAQVEEALPALEADVDRLGRRDRTAEAAYIEACQERLTLQRLLGTATEG
jgi:hypothetical protein